MTFDPSSLKAVCFDVQGTLVDFYTPLIEAGEALAERRQFGADWSEVIARWRAGYRTGMDAILAGDRTAARKLSLAWASRIRAGPPSTRNVCGTRAGNWTQLPGPASHSLSPQRITMWPSSM